MRAHGAGGAGLPRRGQARDRPGGEPRAEVSGVATATADRAAVARADAYMNRQYLDPALLGTLPGRAGRDLRRRPGRTGRRRTWRWPASRSTSLGVNYYTRSVTRDDADAWPTRAVVGACRSGRPTPRPAGRSIPPGPDRHAALGQGALRRPAALHHRERRRVLRSAGGRGRPRARPAARRLPARAPARRARRHRARASTCAATWSGRCSTTSSGRSASPSASASSTSTSRPRSARPRTAPASTRASSPPTARALTDEDEK